MIIGSTTQVSFKLEIQGTTDRPRVRVALESAPELVYYARQVEDYWVADVHVPVIISPGSYRMRIEVMLGNRIFTPVSKMVDVSQPNVNLDSPPRDAIFFLNDADRPAPTVVDAEPPAVAAACPGDLPEATSAPVPAAEIADEKKPTEKKPVQLRAELLSSIIENEPPGGQPEVPAARKDTSVGRGKGRQKPLPVIEIKQEIPVVLIKGEVVFE